MEKLNKLPIISYYASSIFLVLYLVFWAFLHIPFIYYAPGLYDFYTYTYGIIALLGSLGGFYTVSLFGGLTSELGKALFLFSIGLIFQFFGQLTFAYYSYFLGIENPYPSLMEVFYFGSIPIYFMAMFFLGKAAGLQYLVKIAKGKMLLSLLIPLFMVALAYFMFLADYPIAETSALIIFLDFGYPIGQALQVSMALAVYFLSYKLLGGALRRTVLQFIYALFIQFLADMLYTVQTLKESWTAAGTSDLLYLLSYFVMGYAIYQFYTVFI